MIVALYRMTHDGWTANDALAEADRNGMRRTQFWMRDYTEDYGERMAKVGPNSAFTSTDQAFDDHVGDGMRFMERGAFRVRKVAGQFLRRFSASFR